MKPEELGKSILTQRKKWGITQKTLALGLCSNMTISRMENGQRFPGYDVVTAVLERLGLYDVHGYALVSQTEKSALFLRKKIETESIHLYFAHGDERKKIQDAIEGHLDEIRTITKERDTIHRQFVSVIEIWLSIDKKPGDLDREVQALESALRLTAPEFKEDNIRCGIWTQEEAGILLLTGKLYVETGESKRGEEIFEQLYKCLITRYRDHPLLSSVAYHYASALMRKGLFEDALVVVNMGLNVAISKERGSMHPVQLQSVLYHVRAECYYSLGNVDQSREDSLTAYYLYSFTGDQENLHLMHNNIRDRFHLLADELCR